MFDSVIAATVTYGERWQYLRQLIVRLNEIQNVKTLIIYGNGTKYSIAERLQSELPNRRLEVLVFESKTNLGSAGGFKNVLERCRAVKQPNDYVLMLDDDNIPERNVFENLTKDVAKKLSSQKKYVYSFFRDRYDTSLFESKRLYRTARYYDTYCKFSILNKLDHNRYTYKNPYEVFAEVPYSQYSGLLFDAELLDTVGLPNENYYLYVDDTDFSYRMTLAGYHILVYRRGRVTDLENSWSQVTRTSEIDPHKSIFKTPDISRGLYYIRNRVQFEKKYLVKNTLVYNLNILVYYLGIAVLFMPKNKMGIKTFLKMLWSVHLGKKGQLGEISRE